ncbi:MAG: hypothetical protein GEU82_09870 [Luteitalea sp.]|nr:hypothetical protein [Luteitalea sp.]
MRRRTAIPMTVVALLSCGLVPLAGQGPAPAPKAATTAAANAVAPKTPWGDPDLQGLWSNATITPLERPRDLGNREFYTEQEVAQREQRAIAQATDEARGNDARSDVAGAYNDFWWDRGTKDVGTRRTSLIVRPPNGRIPWRPEVQQKYAERSKVRNTMLESPDPVTTWLDVDTGERCLTDGIPWTPYAYNNNYQIVQSPGNVAIVHEQFRELRVIPIGAIPQGKIPQWFGTSRGRWEGNTLVVETDNFADKTAYQWAAAWRQARPTYHLVERFTRTAADTLLYEFTVTDPTLFTDSWTAQTPMTRAEGELFEYACHEGNYSMTSMLGNTAGKK